MKRILLVTFTFLLLIPFFGCSQPNINITSSPSVQSSIINIEQEPSPTPKQTLSEEEKRNNQVFTELIGQCKKYNDWSAAVTPWHVYKR